MSRNIIGRIKWTWEACESCAKHENGCASDYISTTEVDDDVLCLDHEPRQETKPEEAIDDSM